MLNDISSRRHFRAFINNNNMGISCMDVKQSVPITGIVSKFGLKMMLVQNMMYIGRSIHKSTTKHQIHSK